MFQAGGDLFYDAENNVIADKSPAVKQAWDTSIKMVDANITAKTATWSPEWSAGFKQGTFAATFCPSWMLGIVEGNSGAENKGKWDVAGGAGRRRQLGRLVAGRAGARQVPRPRRPSSPSA